MSRDTQFTACRPAVQRTGDGCPAGVVRINRSVSVSVSVCVSVCMCLCLWILQRTLQWSCLAVTTEPCALCPMREATKARYALVCAQVYKVRCRRICGGSQHDNDAEAGAEQPLSRDGDQEQRVEEGQPVQRVAGDAEEQRCRDVAEDVVDVVEAGDEAECVGWSLLRPVISSSG